MDFGRQVEKAAGLKGQFVHIEISTAMGTLSGFLLSGPLESAMVHQDDPSWHFAMVREEALAGHGTSLRNGPQ
jgi:hypothetical protein